MSKYREVPEWWYGALWLTSIAFGLAVVLGYPTQLPWWGFLVSCVVALVFMLPLVLIQGITNIQLSLNVLSPFIAGYLFPGMPIAVMLFKVFSTIVIGNAQTFTSDLKLGKSQFGYLHISTLTSPLVQHII
jgi:hypothetical protein